MLRSLVALVSLLGAISASSQTIVHQSQDKLNWDIFQKLYPPRALAAREQGAVGFTVTLNNRGDVTNCQVTHTSGHPLLDEETCKLITTNAMFKPDANLGLSQTKTHEGMIVWKLPQWATTLAPPTPIAAARAPEKTVCKKALKIGTLSGYERTCMTLTEWAKQSDNQKQPYDEVQGRKGSTSGVSCIGPSGC